MQTNPDTIHPDTELEPGTLAAATLACDESDIDPMTLARLDIGLLRCLRNLGTPRQRICSALCLSYAEYDSISRSMLPDVTDVPHEPQVTSRSR